MVTLLLIDFISSMTFQCLVTYSNRYVGGANLPVKLFVEPKRRDPKIPEGY